MARAPIGDNHEKGLIVRDGLVGDALDVTGDSLANSNPIHVAVVNGSGNQITSFGADTQYTEGDTDSTITGTAIMWEDTSDTLRAVSAAKPLPVGNITASTDSYPMYSRRDLGGGKLSTDAAGALQIYGGVNTDEGTGRVNFAGTSLSISPASATFTNGSYTVTGSGFASAELHYMDYIKLGTDSETAWAQVSFVDSDTSITLMTPYAGTGGTGTYNLAYAATVTGTGATISVASGQATIALGTNTTAATVLYRAAGAPPIKNFTFQSSFSVSQRVANQDIYVGLESATSSPKFFSRFHFNSTTNTTVITETGYNPTTTPSASETETNTITLPDAATTASVNTYRIESHFDRVIFFINGKAVATHLKRLPHIAAQIMNAQFRGVNSGAVTNTNIVIDYIMLRTFERLDVYQPTIPEAAHATDTSGTGSYSMALLAELDDTSPTTVTENQFGNLRMGAKRSLHMQIRDAAGNDRGANVNASNQLSVSADAVTPGTAATNLGKAEDAVHASGDTGVFGLGVGNVAQTTLAADGDYIGHAVDTKGNALVVGNVASAATDAGNPVKMGGVYNTTAPTYTNGQRGDFQIDANGNQKVTQGAVEVATPFNAVENDVDISVKASAGYLLSVSVCNYNATKRYFQIHNKATAPAGADVPVFSYPISAGTANAPGNLILDEMFFGPGGYSCTTGISLGISTTASTFTAATTTDHVIGGVYV